MMGFTTSIVEEVITKKGTLGQIGFITPSPPLFITISGAATVGTFVALAVTFYNASTGKMTARQALPTAVLPNRPCLLLLHISMQAAVSVFLQCIELVKLKC